MRQQFMRLAMLAAALVVTSPAQAQREPREYEAYAGRSLDGDACDPAGSTRTMSVCFALWRESEEVALEQTYNRLLAYAREKEAQSPLFSGSQGYVASIMTAQEGWISWRNNECWLMTLSEVGGSIRSLGYLDCQASLTAQRREHLDAVLELWRAEFRAADGEPSGVGCVLEPFAFGKCARLASATSATP